MPPSRSPVPRSLWPLLILVLAAGAWLLFSQQGPAPVAPGSLSGAARPEWGGGEEAAAEPGGRAGGVRGGEAGGEAGLEARGAPRPAGGRPLLPFAAAEVVRIAAVGAGVDAALARDEGGGWRLERPWLDDLDGEQIGELLAQWAAEWLVPLPEVPDPTTEQLREYGLAEGAGLTLTLTSRDGRAAVAVLGRRNPVLERFYVRLPGRPGLFTIAASAAEQVAALPHPARLRQLWPHFELGDIDTVAVRPAGAAAADVFALDGQGRWWLRQPADGLARLPSVAVEYARHYGDRRRMDGATAWWRASDRAVRDLLFQLRDTRVKRFLLPAAPAESLRAAGVGAGAVAVRAVDVAAAGVAIREAVFGARLLGGEWAAVRHGHLLRVDAPGPTSAARPLADLLDVSALPLSPDDLDSLRIERPDGAGVTGRRHGRDWSVDLPGNATSESPPGVLFGHMVLRLERLAIRRVLPPVKGRDPLAEPYRFYLTAWPRGGAVADLDLGLLAGASDEAAVWNSADGRLVAVDREILVDLKTLFMSLGLARP